MITSTYKTVLFMLLYVLFPMFFIGNAPICTIMETICYETQLGEHYLNKLLSILHCTIIVFIQNTSLFLLLLRSMFYMYIVLFALIIFLIPFNLSIFGKKYGRSLLFNMSSGMHLLQLHLSFKSGCSRYTECL